ncbi:MAG: dihydrofolate reductase, partial [Betaproteobacteria bacterium]|nr:dihydrofolate reductase [Betaproteobacteria bacterium]
MSQRVIASQFGEVLDSLLVQALPEVEFLSLPPGAPASLPPNVEVLLAATFPN